MVLQSEEVSVCFQLCMKIGNVFAPKFSFKNVDEKECIYNGIHSPCYPQKRKKY